MNKQIIFFAMVLITVTAASAALDVFPDYVRGQAKYSNGTVLPAGSEVLVKLVSGDNSGSVYRTYVDTTKIPPFLLGKGYFDTGDQTIFNTGDNFLVMIYSDGFYGEATGTFVTGGNGDFRTQPVIVELTKRGSGTPYNEAEPIAKSVSHEGTTSGEWVINTGSTNQTIEISTAAMTGAAPAIITEQNKGTIGSELENPASTKCILTILILALIVVIGGMIAFARKKK